MNVAEQVNLTALSTSIQSLIEESESLDVQKSAALDKLRKLLPKPKRSQHGIVGRIQYRWWRLRATCRSLKGKDRLRQMALWNEPSLDEQYMAFKHHSKLSPPIKHLKEIKKVLQEIREINVKLKGFEGGFISEEGIKVR